MSDESNSLLTALRESLAVIRIAQRETDRRLQIVRKATEANAEVLDVLTKPQVTNAENSSACAPRRETPMGKNREAVLPAHANRQRGAAQRLADPTLGGQTGLDAVLAKARAIRGAEKDLPRRGAASRSDWEKSDKANSAAEPSDDVEAAPLPPAQVQLPAVQLQANASGLRKSLKRWRSVQSTLPASWLRSDSRCETSANTTGSSSAPQIASPSSVPTSPMARYPLQNRSPDDETAHTRARFLASMGGMPTNPPVRWQGSNGSSGESTSSRNSSSSSSYDKACLAPEAANTLAQGLAAQLAAHVSTDQIDGFSSPLASSNALEDSNSNEDEDSDNRRIVALYKAWYRAQRLSALARSLADIMAHGPGPHPRPAPPWPSSTSSTTDSAATTSAPLSEITDVPRHNDENNRILAATTRRIPACPPVAFGLASTTSSNSSCNSTSNKTSANGSYVHLPAPGAVESAVVAAFDSTTAARLNAGGASSTSTHSSPLRASPIAASAPTASPAPMPGFPSPTRDGGSASLLRQHTKTYHEATEAVVLGEVRRVAGAALLPPLLAQLRSLVARNCTTAHPSNSDPIGMNHENATVMEERWRDALAVWRASEAILVTNGKPATGFVRLS